MEQKTETKLKLPVRPKRKPVATRQRLEFLNLDPNRSYRLIDATPERIQAFEDAGYKIEEVKSHVRGGQRTDVATPVDNMLPVGSGKRQLLVSIEKEYYDEDQEAKAREIDEKEAGIKNPPEGFTGSVKLSEEGRGRR